MKHTTQGAKRHTSCHYCNRFEVLPQSYRGFTAVESQPYRNRNADRPHRSTNIQPIYNQYTTNIQTNIQKKKGQKKGDKKCPANYRGITLTSCLGKLFTSILQNRLNKFIEQHNILNPEQFGFRPNARTTNSLFIRRQLLHKYTTHKALLVSLITKKLLIVYGNSV